MKTDKDRPLLQIQASAGAGKTWDLTRRYLGRLAACGRDCGRGSGACALADKDSHNWNDIIAVTFTNAAAAEMRERVLGRLKAVALGELDKGVPFSKEEAACWVDAMLRNMSALNIRTIDSLLHLIVRSSALDLGLAPGFEPVFATEEALTPYFDLLLERAWREDGPMRELLRLACNALATKESTGFMIGDKLHRRLKDIVDDVLRGRLKGLSPSEEIKEKLEYSQNEARLAADGLLAVAEKTGASWKKTPLRIISEIAAGDTEKCNLKTSVDPDVKKFFSGNSHPKALEQAHARFVAAAEHCKECREYLRPALRYAPVVLLAQTLAEAFFQNKEQESCIPGVLIPQWASDSLAGQHGVSQALCRLGARLTHFLVDEFQDTSQEQWQSLRLLAADALARGGTLTWVGDVKQSIYSWRGADSTLFNAILDDHELTRMIDKGKQNSPLNLDINWRSRKEIVAHNNGVFAPLGGTDCAREMLQMLWPNMPEPHMDMAVSRLSAAFANAAQKCSDKPDNNGGYVHMERIERDNVAELDEAVASRLCSLLREEIISRRKLSDILVLVRRNEDARLAAEALAREGIPVITENSLLLAVHPLIKQATAFLDFLDSPEDDVAFWAMLTGSLVLGHPLAQGLTLEELHNWCVERGPGPLFLQFRSAWPEIWERLFEPFHAQSSLLTPYDATREWLLRLDAETRFPYERTFLRRFLEVLQNAEEKGFASLGTFLEHWRSHGDDEKAPMPNGMDAVRVMTIHKAKGLEAPCVVVPWTSFKIASTRKLEVHEFDGLRIAVPLGKNCGDSYWQDIIAQTCESLHLLYVAFTRAKDELYIFRTGTKALDDGSSLGKVLDALWAKAQFASAFPLGTPVTDTSNAPPKEVRSGEAPTEATGIEELCLDSDSAGTGEAASENTPDSWRPMQWLPKLKIFRHELSDAAFEAVDRGNLLHLCLERLRCTGNPKEDAKAALNSALATLELPVPEDALSLGDLVDAVAWFASQPCAARWLAAGRPEQPLISADKELLRVDLLVRESWGTLIIDYKSGEPVAEHVQQLRRYVKILSSLPENGETRGLLVYLDQRRFQLVTADATSELMPDCESLLRLVKASASRKKSGGSK